MISDTHHPVQPISVVLLVHNEAEIIEQVITDFHEKLIAKIPHSEIIIGEDGSTDGTKEILHKLASTHATIFLSQDKARVGYAKALRNAIMKTKNNLILLCDASGKYDANDFWFLYEKIVNHDMVVGYKVKRKDPFYRNMLSYFFNKLVNAYFNVSFRDIDCPLRLVKKTALLKVANENWIQKDLINFEITIRMIAMNYKVTEVPIRHYTRKNGISRGLPLAKIPKVIFQTLLNFRRLAKSLNHS